ncbi:MAG: type II toxin-antitoxin system RelE/ParE family toxin, partial [Rhodospirillales bacterium]
EKTAVEFARALKRAFIHIALLPASGSSRWAHVLGLRGLRTWPLTGFPYLVFFTEGVDQIDVWRVLHQERDIPKWMGEGT